MTKETIEDHHPLTDREIVLGGVSDVWPQTKAGGGWLTQLYAQANMNDHIDYLAVHPYSYSLSPDTDNPEGITRSIDPFVYLKQADGGETGDSPLEFISTIIGEIPLSITEIGWNASEPTEEDDGISYGINQCHYLNPVTGNLNETGTIVPEWLQANFLDESYKILLDPDITHYPNRRGDSNIDGTIFWYRFDDIKIRVAEQYQEECEQDSTSNPQGSLAGALPIGVANPPTTTLTRNRKNENEAMIPINHWWGIIDEDSNKKSAYCSYMRVAIRQGALDDYTDESCRRSQIPSATTINAVYSRTKTSWQIIISSVLALLTTVTLRVKIQ